MSSRQIKEEMLQAIHPEIYKPTIGVLKRERRRPRLKREDVKTLTKTESKRARKRRADELDEEVEFVRRFAPRRRLQWRGRPVKRVLRPGTVVTFTPGQRSGPSSKRSYDEVYADEDILEQEGKRQGEFAYGKRIRYSEPGEKIVPLDSANPTPSLKPITEQKVLPVGGLKRKSDQLEIQPTMQLLAPKKRKLAPDDDVFTPVRRSARIKEVKVRSIKRVAPGVGISTVDVTLPMNVDVPGTSVDIQIPTSSSRAATVDVGAVTPMDTVVGPIMAEASTNTEAPRAPRRRHAPTARSGVSALFPEYALHPSITPTPGYRGRVFVRSERAPTRRSRRRRVNPVNNILPGVRYHPTISLPPSVMRVLQR
nr:V protein [Lemur mastadenovirus]